MKLYISGMAGYQEEVYSRLSSDAFNIAEHAVRLAAYGIKCDYFKHWIHEIRNFIIKDGSGVIKKQGRPSRKAFESYMFKDLPCTVSSARSQLEVFLKRVENGELVNSDGFDYEPYEITNKMCADLSVFCRNLKKHCCDYIPNIPKDIDITKDDSIKNHLDLLITELAQMSFENETNGILGNQR